MIIQISKVILKVLDLPEFSGLLCSNSSHVYILWQLLQVLCSFYGYHVITRFKQVLFISTHWACSTSHRFIVGSWSILFSMHGFCKTKLDDGTFGRRKASVHTSKNIARSILELHTYLCFLRAQCFTSLKDERNSYSTIIQMSVLKDKYGDLKIPKQFIMQFHFFTTKLKGVLDKIFQS